MQATLDHLRNTGYPVNQEDISHLSSILSAHLYFHGAHHFDLLAAKKRQEQ